MDTYPLQYPLQLPASGIRSLTLPSAWASIPGEVETIIEFQGARRVAGSELIFVPLTVAFAIGGGVITTAHLGRAVTARQGKRDSISAFLKAVYASRDWRTKGAFLITLGDAAAAVTVLVSLFVFFSNGSTHGEAVFLIASIVVQIVVAIAALLLSLSFSRATIAGRSEQGRQPGGRFASRNISGGQSVPLQTAERPMPRKQPLTRQERAKLVELGAQKYEKLRPEIERTHAGKYIAIKVKSDGTHDDAKLKAFAESLEPGDFLWTARIGSA
jgi:hypothetical protein